MYYNIKIKSNGSEFILESKNKSITQREMDLYFAYIFGASYEFKSKIKKIEVANYDVKSIEEFELKSIDLNPDINEPIQKMEFSIQAEDVCDDESDNLESVNEIFADPNKHDVKNIVNDDVLHTSEDIIIQETDEDSSIDEVENISNDAIKENFVDENISETIEQFVMQEFEVLPEDMASGDEPNADEGKFIPKTDSVIDSSIPINGVITANEDLPVGQNVLQTSKSQDVEYDTIDFEFEPNEADSNNNVAEIKPDITADDVEVQQTEQNKDNEIDSLISQMQKEIESHDIESNDFSASDLDILGADCNSKSDLKVEQVDNSCCQTTQENINNIFFQADNNTVLNQQSGQNNQAETTQPVEQKTVVDEKIDFKNYLDQFEANNLEDQFLICAYYLKNLVKQNHFTMKSINSKLFQTVGKIADMSILNNLLNANFIQAVELDSGKCYFITEDGENYFAKKFS